MKARWVVVAAAIAAMTTGCAPSAKPVGYAGGTVLAIGGLAMLADAGTRDCDSDEPLDFTPVFCAGGSILEGTVGAVIGLTGLIILIATAASPDAPAPIAPGLAPGGLPPPPPPPAPVEEEPPDWPRALLSIRRAKAIAEAPALAPTSAPMLAPPPAFP